MRIGELAAATGVSVRSLRYYEQQGLLAAERSPSGQRLYPQSAVHRVRVIQQLYAAAVPSKSIREMLPHVVDGQATPELLDRLAAEGDRIDGRIGELESARARLGEVIVAVENSLTGKDCQAQ
ncbi:MerR family transcriptional regulator [Streptomyces varsoviensis]|uniref:MerR family transcriptional regulator n=1 Tax=Streptomyces varsoviensis TaxID=67373 RepID=A0ABR5IZM1_9ACTN|nr:MerR family transcriptional regulator [Streptomyces varsoviensis]KOG86611.1 MerR family transcriptional regulator [Streptomyces varsoviensis]